MGRFKFPPEFKKRICTCTNDIPADVRSPIVLVVPALSLGNCSWSTCTGDGIEEQQVQLGDTASGSHSKPGELSALAWSNFQTPELLWSAQRWLLRPESESGSGFIES